MGCSDDSPSPHQVKVECNRAMVYAEKGDYNAAIELDPTMPETYANRAEAHFVKCPDDEAWADVKTWRKLGRKIDPKFLAGLR